VYFGFGFFVNFFLCVPKEVHDIWEGAFWGNKAKKKKNFSTR